MSIMDGSQYEMQREKESELRKYRQDREIAYKNPNSMGVHTMDYERVRISPKEMNPNSIESLVQQISENLRELKNIQLSAVEALEGPRPEANLKEGIEPKMGIKQLLEKTLSQVAINLELARQIRNSL